MCFDYNKRKHHNPDAYHCRLHAHKGKIQLDHCNASALLFPTCLCPELIFNQFYCDNLYRFFFILLPHSAKLLEYFIVYHFKFIDIFMFYVAIVDKNNAYEDNKASNNPC